MAQPNSSPRNSRIRPGTVLIALGCIAAGFVYGYVAQRDQLFPYGLRSALTKKLTTEEPKTAAHLREDEIQRLLSLGYLAGYETGPDNSGVTVHDEEDAYLGLNLLTSGHGTDVDLFDMQGEVVHRWSYHAPKLWGGDEAATGYFRRAHVFDNGDLLVLYDPRSQEEREKNVLLKLDSKSDLLWSFADGSHHDFDVQPDGRIYLLTRDYNNYPNFRKGADVLEDYITVLDAAGNPQRRVSILQAFRNSPYAALLERAPKVVDLLHTNSIEVLDGRLAGKSEAFRAGNVLVSMRHISAIAVIDMDTEKVVWAMTQMWHLQHQPTVLDNRNILLFDNNGHQGFSRVIEFDPITQEMTWSYETEKPEDFYSDVCGSNARLPNGNTLITESTAGRAFEVTPDKRIVWEFFNPYRAGDDGQLIAIIPELVRLATNTVPPWADAP